MFLDQIKKEAAALAASDPQRAHLVSQHVLEIEAAQAKLLALGFPLEVAAAQAPAPQEWPKWVDGVLWQDQATYDKAQADTKASAKADAKAAKG